MANYIDRYLTIAPSTPVQKTPEPVAVMTTAQPRQTQTLGSNVLEKYKQNTNLKMANLMKIKDAKPRG